MGKKYMRLFERKAYIIKGILHINRFTILSETLWFVRDTCQMMSVNIMSRAGSPALVILGHRSVYMINATLNDLLNQYLATANHNVENIV